MQDLKSHIQMRKTKKEGRKEGRKKRRKQREFCQLQRKLFCIFFWVLKRMIHSAMSTTWMFTPTRPWVIFQQGRVSGFSHCNHFAAITQQSRHSCSSERGWEFSHHWVYLMVWKWLRLASRSNDQWAKTTHFTLRKIDSRSNIRSAWTPKKSKLQHNFYHNNRLWECRCSQQYYIYSFDG